MTNRKINDKHITKVSQFANVRLANESSSANKITLNEVLCGPCRNRMANYDTMPGKDAHLLTAICVCSLSLSVNLTLCRFYANIPIYHKKMRSNCCVRLSVFGFLSLSKVVLFYVRNALAMLFALLNTGQSLKRTAHCVTFDHR